MIINNEIANISDPYTFWCDKNLNNKKLITSIMKNLVIGIILSAILNYFIIPQFGVIGCSVVTVLVTFTTAFLLQINITRITELSMKDFYTLPSREDVMSIFLFKKK